MEVSVTASKTAAPHETWVALKSSLNAPPDSIDIRDWVYQPGLPPVPPLLVNSARVPKTLDQGRRVSPRMLYEMAPLGRMAGR